MVLNLVMRKQVRSVPAFDTYRVAQPKMIR